MISSNQKKYVIFHRASKIDPNDNLTMSSWKTYKDRHSFGLLSISFSPLKRKTPRKKSNILIPF